MGREYKIKNQKRYEEVGTVGKFRQLAEEMRRVALKNPYCATPENIETYKRCLVDPYDLTEMTIIFTLDMDEVRGALWHLSVSATAAESVLMGLPESRKGYFKDLLTDFFQNIKRNPVMVEMTENVIHFFQKKDL